MFHLLVPLPRATAAAGCSSFQTAFGSIARWPIRPGARVVVWELRRMLKRTGRYEYPPVGNKEVGQGARDDGKKGRNDRFDSGGTGQKAHKEEVSRLGDQAICQVETKRRHAQGRRDEAPPVGPRPPDMPNKVVEHRR